MPNEELHEGSKRRSIRNSHFPWAFLAQSRLVGTRINVAFDDEVGLPCRSLVRRQALGKTVFNSGKMFSKLGETWWSKSNPESNGEMAARPREFTILL